jgi:DEAD/DEAH box helicase domain-containing protein
VTAVRRLPAAAAVYGEFPVALDPRLRAALDERGVRQLYSHQAEAIEHALAGRDVVVVTPTASGKTLCYNAPMLQAILEDSSSRGLYLFPTKALAQDQLAELSGLCGALAGQSGDQIGVYTYDGDTPQDARRTIRSRAHIVLSNPDMLHSGILPHHPRWAKLFENLRYVVIDELHAYRGVFGSHLCNLLRRLRRVCRHYGSDPVFLCSSATIANPRALAERLTEREFVLVERSGAPRGEKYFVFVNPPVVNAQLGIRRSYLGETRRIAGEFLKRNLQAIVFAQSRLATEILTTYLKDDFEGNPGGPERIRGYRGGYLPNRRREIEKGLRDGTVRTVVSTNALELGIDIGALDVCVMAGYPGTIAATWQRAGRAGRRSGRSAAVLVASSAPLDQFIVRNPSYFFDASPEHALIDPDNLHILVEHIKCATFELPITSDERFGRHDVQEILGLLAEQGLVYGQAVEADSGGRDTVPADGGRDSQQPEAESLGSRPRGRDTVPARGGAASAPSALRRASPELEERRRGAPREVKNWVWTSEAYPANAVSLRSVSSDNFVVVDTTAEPVVIGETDFTSGPATLHPKAIYIVEAKLFQVEKLDFEGRKAFVRQIDSDYYTTAISYTRVTVLDIFEEAGRGQSSAIGRGRESTLEAEAERSLRDRRVGVGPHAQLNDAVTASHGEVHVVSRVVGFKKIKFYTNENVGSGELDLPEQQMHTTSYWLTIPAEVITGLPYAADDRRDGVVGLSFAMRQVSQLLLMCDAHDVGISIETGERDGLPADTQDARIFIYDNYPGGIGFSEPLFRMHHELIDATRRLIAECPCENGCPGCVGPIGYTGPQAKFAALAILRLLQHGCLEAGTTEGMVPF